MQVEWAEVEVSGDQTAVGRVAGLHPRATFEVVDEVRKSAAVDQRNDFTDSSEIGTWHGDKLDRLHDTIAAPSITHGIAARQAATAASTSLGSNQRPCLRSAGSHASGASPRS